MSKHRMGPQPRSEKIDPNRSLTAPAPTPPSATADPNRSPTAPTPPAPTLPSLTSATHPNPLSAPAATPTRGELVPPLSPSAAPTTQAPWPSPTVTGDPTPRLNQHLKELRLPTIREQFQALADQAAREGLSYPQYLSELTSRECQARNHSRIQRLLRHSRLLQGKTWDRFDWTRLPLAVMRQLQSLREGSFLDRRENLLVFGKPGSGKTHLLAALGEQLIQRGRRVLFSTCSLLVQDLLAAKRELKLERHIKRLSSFEALIIDDLGYVQQSREEMEVLFTLLAERYERGSVLLTSNLPFSQWEQIFKDPMTTAAAIDRLVHHSVIIELNIPSYRLETAKNTRKTSAAADGSAPGS
jgi:DNA replication protein DnaC